ncbi:Cytochrome o ubiquinol oxidase subunit 3 [Candidatus Protochlamydia naegleriophila]|uniref:Cytochrome bo(3) ubiquinol oxidase subunit 3 n=1 Tax=Candidatus Protochlamydia naegleriophila TaxID=389348 RepID=A0A0U5J889_9BACT|nr:cytochrome o ubiquinol oxidase subunit III [Candidatus Protochlamydia naegleriophila]CUI16297.1 Cytochrome o ubiquinol oxidase subunit 3 [Candidatus Protochlamydia naegleriophila]
MNSSMIHHQDTLEPHADTRLPDPHQDTFSKTTLGFWMYLMTDCLLFATLFCTYAVLHKSTFGGPSSKELFDLPSAFTETMILLLSSVTCGFAMLASLRNEKKQVLIWLAVSFLLGASFIALELNEFKHMVSEGHDWTRSAFLSAFFTLVGTHGLHVVIGLLWMLVMMAQVFSMGITATTFRRLAIFSLFWHFLDLIWISIFTFVYLMGVI